jgi:GPH family glycoside/pentoside/hexuronide:cation symporter
MEKEKFIDKPVFNTRIKSANVKFTEMLLGFLIGPMGGGITSALFSSFLNKYWTDVVKDLDPAFLTVFPLVSIVFIVIGNLVAGRLIDRTRTRQGKARPYILLSAPLMAAASILLFAVPAGNTTLELIWVALSYNIFYSIAYPLYYTSNALMLPLSTRNAKQRGLLSTFVNVGGLAAASFASMVFPWILSIPAFADRSAWLVLIIVLGAFAFAAILLQYYFTRERISEESVKLNIKEEKIPMSRQVKAAVTDRYWWMIIAFYLVFMIVGTMQNLSMAYYCDYIYGSYNDGSQSLLAIITGIPLGAGMLFAWPLASKFGKKRCTVVGLLISAGGCLMTFLAGGNKGLIIAGLLIKCLGAVPANYVMMALLADVLDHLEAKNGFRCDGFTMSLYSIIMATVSSICMGIFNGMIGASGYLAPVNNAAQAQNAGTLSAINWCYVGFMMVGYAACALIILGLNVEKGLDKEHQDILERQKKAVLEAGGTWIEPQERLKLEQEEADRLAEEARKEELKARCQKKGLDYEEEEGKYEARLKERQEKAAAKKDRKK